MKEDILNDVQAAYSARIHLPWCQQNTTDDIYALYHISGVWKYKIKVPTQLISDKTFLPSLVGYTSALSHGVFSAHTFHSVFLHIRISVMLDELI